MKGEKTNIEIETKRNAYKDSKKAMRVMLFSSLLILAKFRLPPIEKAISPRVISTTQERSFTSISSGIRLKPDGPIRTPASIYPEISGSLNFLATLPLKYPTNKRTPNAKTIFISLISL